MCIRDRARADFKKDATQVLRPDLLARIANGELLDEHGASNQTILEAAQSCPYKAIILKNKDNNERIYP